MGKKGEGIESKGLSVCLRSQHSGIARRSSSFANNILTVLLQYAANLREVIVIGVEFGFRVLR